MADHMADHEAKVGANAGAEVQAADIQAALEICGEVLSA